MTPPLNHAGGLCSGYYALQAALRYEHCWLRLLHLAHSADLQQQQPPGGGGPSPVGAPAGPGAVPPGMTPPLDVAWCWWVRMWGVLSGGSSYPAYLRTVAAGQLPDIRNTSKRRPHRDFVRQTPTLQWVI